MRIGFDISQTGQAKAGCGFLADSLARALVRQCPDDEFLFYATFGDFFWDPDFWQTTLRLDAPNVRYPLVPPTQDAASRFWREGAPLRSPVLGSPDVVHANNFFCPPADGRPRLVYTLYDLSFVRHPEWTTEENRRGCLAGVFRASLQADLVLAISEFSREEFLSVFPHYPAERVRSFPLGSRFDDAVPGKRPDDVRIQAGDFFLCVGTIEPRKNHVGLLRAYAQVKARRAVPPLLLVGKVGWMAEGVFAAIAELGLADDVIFPGYLSDDELKWLYQNCLGVLYPTHWEGFGLPVLEALSQGAYVVTSNVSSLPEVIGEAGVTLAPDDVDGLAEAMMRVLDDPLVRGSYKAKAFDQARRYTWEAAARAVRDAYDTVLSLPPIAACLPAQEPVRRAG